MAASAILNVNISGEVKDILRTLKPQSKTGVVKMRAEFSTQSTRFKDHCQLNEPAGDEVTANILIACPVSACLGKMRRARIKPVAPSGDCSSNAKQQHHGFMQNFGNEECQRISGAAASEEKRKFFVHLLRG